MRNYAKQNEVREMDLSLRVRRDVAAKLKRLETASCPFANLPEKKRTQWALTKEEMKNCVWLQAEVVRRLSSRNDAGWSPETFKVCRVEGRRRRAA
jgi:hypothetical protein